jgi:hypothetical protein
MQEQWVFRTEMLLASTGADVMVSKVSSQMRGKIAATGSSSFNVLDTGPPATAMRMVSHTAWTVIRWAIGGVETMDIEARVAITTIAETGTLSSNA